MKTTTKRLIGRALTSPPLYPLLRARALSGGALTVLCYHTLGTDDAEVDAWTMLRASEFRRQVRFLKRHYEIVDLDAALAPAPQRVRPRAVLTFDDGDVGLAKHLIPVLEAEGVPCTIYIATGQIEAGEAYWFDRVMNALQGPGSTRIDLTGVGLRAWTVGPERAASRWLVINDILETLKRESPDDRDQLVEAILSQATRDPGSPSQALGPMSRDALQKLASHPLVTIGAHSHCHNLLDQIPIANAGASAVRSRELLQEWTQSEVRHFAWPNGNHNAALRDSLRSLGFASAVALDMDLARSDGDPFAISRVGIGRYDAPWQFRLRLLGKGVFRRSEQPK